MKQGTAELLLLTVIVSRSISYLLSKIGLHGVPPLELLAIRFFPDHHHFTDYFS